MIPERLGREGESQPLPTVGQEDVSTPAQRFIRTVGETQNSKASESIANDLEARIQLGVKRYGQRLSTYNGRSMLQDAYEEALDLYHYLYGNLLEAGQNRMGRPWFMVANAQHLLFQIREELDKVNGRDS